MISQNKLLKVAEYATQNGFCFEMYRSKSYFTIKGITMIYHHTSNDVVVSITERDIAKLEIADAIVTKLNTAKLSM